MSKGKFAIPALGQLQSRRRGRIVDGVAVYEDGTPVDGVAPNVAGGKKFDAGKTRFDLLPFRAIEQIAKVISFGASKYGANNWQKLLSPNGRYFAALMRHVTAWKLGETTDPESGLPHLAHAGCCLLFLLSMGVGLDPDMDPQNEGPEAQP